MATSAPRRSALLLEVGLSLAYPLLVHGLLRAGFERALAGILLALSLVLAVWGAASLSSSRSGVALRNLGLALVLAVLAGAAWFERARAVLLYPLVIQLGLFAVFFFSLFRERTFIESLARLHEPELDAAKRHYCRQATRCWSAFFLGNAAVTAALSFFAPLWVWTLYTGLVSYLLAGTLGLTELWLRVRRFGHAAAGPVGRVALSVLAWLGLEPAAPPRP